MAISMYGNEHYKQNANDPNDDDDDDNEMTLIRILLI